MSIDVLDEAVTSGIIVGVIEAIKPLGLSDRFIPILNLLFGVALQVVWDGKVDAQTVVQGLMAGLAAAGAYRSYRVVVDGK